MEHAHQPFAAFGEFGIGHAAGHRHAARDDQPDVAGMEGRMRPARAPDEIVKALGARPRDRLVDPALLIARSEEHTSELQSLMRISYAILCLKQQKKTATTLVPT